jgi:hypothetical protein
MDACWRGTMTFLDSRSLNRAASHRLAFRELGLAIGLRALPIIGDAIKKKRRGFDARPELPKSVESLLKYEWVGDEILDFWLSQAQHPHGRWQEHQNINDVMLATALIPGGFLSVDFRISADAS